MSTVNAGWRGPNIVKDGLVLYLDAASGTSYSPYNSGTTWRDISGNGYNSALINGPTYNSANGGSISLDGVDDSIYTPSFAIPNNNGQLTFNFWINYQSVPNLGTIIGDGNQSNTVGYIWIYNDSSSNITYQYATAFGRVNIVMGGYMTGRYNTWLNMCFVIDYNLLTFVGYRNGSVVLSTGLAESPSFPSISRLRFIGSYNGASLFNSNMLVSSFMMYTKTLSAQEVLQNYNSTKGRFGL